MIEWPTEWNDLCDFWEVRRTRLTRLVRFGIVATLGCGAVWAAARQAAPTAAQAAFVGALVLACATVVVLKVLQTQRNEFFRRSRALQAEQRSLADDQASEARPGQLPHEPTGAPSVSSFEVTVALDERIDFPTQPDGALTLGPGAVRCQLAIDKEDATPPDHDPNDPVPLRVTCVVVDESGTAWHATTFIHTDMLTNELEPPRAERGHIRFWNDVPDAWRAALDQRIVVNDIWSLIDSRERFEMPVGDLKVTVFNKYQGPRIDCALLEGAGDPAACQLVVRCTDMVYERAVDGAGREVAEDVDQVSYGFLLDAIELLPIVAPDHHYRSLEAWHEGDTSPGPIFQVEAKSMGGAPQQSVSFTPHEEG